MDARSILLNVRYWIVAAIIIGFIVGDIWGGHVSDVLILFLMIMMCFSLTKMDFVREDMFRYRKEVILAFFLCSVIATAVTLLVGLMCPEEMWKGWVILACVPCAISVVSGTMFMKGNSKMIMISLAVIYVIAIGLTPLLSLIFIGSAVDPWEIMKCVLLFVVVPFIVSIPLKRLGIPDDVSTLIINFSFFMFALIAIGRTRDFFFNHSDLAVLVILVTVVRIAVLHLIFEYSMKKAGMPRDMRIPYSLLLIWRNSGLALALVVMLFPMDTMAIAPASISMVFEQFYFMFIMWYYERIVPPEETPSCEL